MSLKPRQRRAAEILVAHPEMKLEDLAADMEVNPSTLWRWRKMPEFKEYQHELCMERFTDLERVALQKLQDNAMKGNQNAIQYILDYMGYKAAQKIEADVTTDIEINIGD